MYFLAINTFLKKDYLLPHSDNTFTYAIKLHTMNVCICTCTFLARLGAHLG